MGREGKGSIEGKGIGSILREGKGGGDGMNGNGNFDGWVHSGL